MYKFRELNKGKLLFNREQIIRIAKDNNDKGFDINFYNSMLFSAPIFYLRFEEEGKRNNEYNEIETILNSKY